MSSIPHVLLSWKLGIGVSNVYNPQFRYKSVQFDVEIIQFELRGLETLRTVEDDETSKPQANKNST